ncbi:MAG: sodium-dependent transporter [Spongiibacteraceae bacterium]
MAVERGQALGIWSSRWTFLAAAIGLTVGLGDIWRRPETIGAQGGAVYLFVYVLFLFLIVVPVAIAEARVGMWARANPLMAMRSLVAQTPAPRWWAWFIQLSVIAALLLAANYSVVAGWLAAYIAKVGSGSFAGASVDGVAAEFRGLLASRDDMLFWQCLVMLFTVSVSAFSVARSMAVGLRVVLPVLLLVLLVFIGYGFRVGDFQQAVTWLFDSRFADFSWRSALSALQSAFYTLCVATGAFMALGAYFPSGRSISRQLVVLAFIDIFVVLLAGLAVFSIVLDQHIEPSSGPALLFVSLPYAFGNTALGDVFGALFFSMVMFFSITTMVVLMEPAVAYLVERWRLPRWLAALMAGLAVSYIGWLSIASLDSESNLQWGGRAFIEYVDIVATYALLPLCGFVFAVFIASWAPPAVFGSPKYWWSRLAFSLWQGLLRYIAPPVFFVMLVVGLYQRLLV